MNHEELAQLFSLQLDWLSDFHVLQRWTTASQRSAWLLRLVPSADCMRHSFDSNDELTSMPINAASFGC
jgi:hypothetical protein